MTKHISSLLFVVLIFMGAVGYSQPGYITTVAGNGSSGFSGDGGMATNARIGQALGAAVDHAGNIYIPDDDNSKIRKVSPGGIITTIAGGGSSLADGIAATAASLDLGLATGAIALDASGNVYISESNRVRKIAITTGIITTVAGSSASGFSGDGGNATAALLAHIQGVFMDAAGNLYISDNGNNRIRKVSPSGIITTVAGSGTSGFSGDGGPATAAQLNYPAGMCLDPAGNLYIADVYNYRIRKVDASGIITTYAGTGTNGFSGDGAAATAATFDEPSNVCIDNLGNLYVADFHNGRIREVSPLGIVTTFAGGGASSGNGIPATSASLTDTWGVAIDANNNIYVADRQHYRICKVNGIASIPTATADSFSVYLQTTCAGPELTVIPAHYSPALHVKTWFGDGAVQTDDFSTYSGNAWLNHTYMSTGTYNIKHVLYNGSVAIDSVQLSYNYIMCNTLSLNFFYDNNGNCSKEISENGLSVPVLISIDSNGVPVDTVSATSGLFYTAYASAGDIYGFKVISGNYSITCPSTGIIYDTVSAGIITSPRKNVGFQCSSITGSDLSVKAVIPVTGVHDQWGNIYVQNLGCVPTDGTLTLHYSHKYAGTPSQIWPVATSVSANTITWNLNSLSSTTGTPVPIHYAIWSGSTLLPIGDTVHSYFEISSSAGDSDPSNNSMIIVDTVKAGCDPNEMWVSPSKCILSGAAPVQLKYTINFENTGNDTAHNICVVDTLPDNVDIMSMRIVMSSNEMYTSKLKDAAGHNILKFYFPNINLLDSSHHGLCDGALIFNINTKSGLADGTHLYNRAGIYFDINDVVMTNGVENLIGCVPESAGHLSVANAGPEVYPNPAADVLSIQADEHTFGSYTITNSMGKIVMAGEIDKAQTQVSIKGQAAGMYFVIIKGKDGSVVRRFVKM